MPLSLGAFGQVSFSKCGVKSFSSQPVERLRHVTCNLQPHPGAHGFGISPLRSA